MKSLFAPISAALVAIGVFLFASNATAYAAGEMAGEEGTLLDLARPIFDQVMKGDYIPAAALALVFCVALVKRYAPGKFGEFVHGDVGGSLTTLLMAFGGALATATIGDAPWTWGMLWTSSQVAFYAAGGYVLIKKLLVEPILKPLSAKAPLWMQPLFQMIFWAFERRLAEAKVVSDATKAGAEAVIATPSTGTDGVLGSPTDVK